MNDELERMWKEEFVAYLPSINVYTETTCPSGQSARTPTQSTMEEHLIFLKKH
jgi:hypothetical protein